MKKKYVEPEMEEIKIQGGGCHMASNDFLEGDSIWDNETPLVPFG